MKRSTKILLGIIAIVVASSIVCCGGAALWFSANEEDFKAVGEEARAAGEAYAVNHTDLECRDRSLEKLDACGLIDFKCTAQSSLFLKYCVRSAARTDEFCENVPDTREMEMTDEVTEIALYVAEECRRLGRPDDQKCTNHLGEVVRLCNARAEVAE